MTGPVSSLNTCWRGCRDGGADPAAWRPEKERRY